MKNSHIIFAVILWLFSPSVFGQTGDKIKMDIIVELPDTNIIFGDYMDALNISQLLDTLVVGLYLMVDEGYTHDIDDLAVPIMSYFDHYNVPAILVKQKVPFKGEGARMRIYIDGERIGGDLSTGDISLYEIVQNHEEAFKLIKGKYVIAEIEILERDIQHSIDNVTSKTTSTSQKKR